MMLRITTHYGDCYEVEDFPFDGNAPDAVDVAEALRLSAFRYNVSHDVAWDLAVDLGHGLEAEYAWSTLALV